MIEFATTVLDSATVLLLVSIAALIAQRSGLFYLGLEGHVIGGAFIAVMVTRETSSVALAVACAVAINAVLAIIFWAMVARLRADPVIAGFALSLLAAAIVVFVDELITNTAGTVLSPAGLPTLRDVFPGQLGQRSILVVVVPLIVIVCWLGLEMTAWGIKVTATGVHPDAARSAGVNIGAVRCSVATIAGSLGGLAGCQLSLGGLDAFTPGMSAGVGYLGLAAVAFGAGRVRGTVLAVLVFALADAVGVRVSVSQSSAIPADFVLMLPYVITLVAVGVAGVRRRRHLTFAVIPWNAH